MARSAFQVQGNRRSSSLAFTAPEAMRSSTSVSQATGSTSLSRAVWMSLWVHGAIPVEPFDVLYARRTCGKIRSPKWRDQLSVYRNHAVYWVYRKDGPTHKRGRAAV